MGVEVSPMLCCIEGKGGDGGGGVEDANREEG